MKTVLVVVGVAGVGGLGYWLWKTGKFKQQNAGPPKTNPAPSMCSQVTTATANIAIKTGDPKTQAGGVVVGVTAPALCKAASWAVGKVTDVAKGVYNTAGDAGKLIGNTVWNQFNEPESAATKARREAQKKLFIANPSLAKAAAQAASGRSGTTGGFTTGKKPFGVDKTPATSVAKLQAFGR